MNDELRNNPLFRREPRRAEGYATPEEAALAGWQPGDEAGLLTSAQVEDAACVLVTTATYDYTVECLCDADGWRDVSASSGAVGWGWTRRWSADDEVGPLVASGHAPAGARRVRVRLGPFDCEADVVRGHWIVVIPDVDPTTIDHHAPIEEVEVLQWDPPPATG